MTLLEYVTINEKGDYSRISKLVAKPVGTVENWARGFGRPSRFDATMIEIYTGNRVAITEWGYQK